MNVNRKSSIPCACVGDGLKWTLVVGKGSVQTRKQLLMVGTGRACSSVPREHQGYQECTKSVPSVYLVAFVLQKPEKLDSQPRSKRLGSLAGHALRVGSCQSQRNG